MNTELLNQIIEKIEAEPQLLEMSHWAIPPEFECGTAHCIGGWAIALTHPGANFFLTGTGANTIELPGETTPYDPSHLAAATLELTPGQAERLFYIHNWVQPFYKEYCDASYDIPCVYKRAEVAIARIRHFIATDGAE